MMRGINTRVLCVSTCVREFALGSLVHDIGDTSNIPIASHTWGGPLARHREGTTR